MSCLTLERMLFDVSDPTNSPIVGSYLLGGSDGTAIGNDGDSLLVKITNAITVDLDGIYNVSTNADPDNIGLIGHTRAASPGDAEQVERITVGAPTADDLVAANIHALDVNSFLYAYDGSTFDRVTSTSGALNINIASSDISVTVAGDVADDATDSGNPIKVGSRSVNQANALGVLSAAGDRADLISDLYRRVFINDAPNIGMAAVNRQVTDTEVALPATNLAGRTRIMIQNLGADPVYIGPTGVLTTSGLKVDKGATLSLEAGEALDFFGIAPAGKTVNVRVLELA